MIPDKKLTLGVILPHTKIFGGVKRFFELGKIFEQRGNQFVVFTPEGIAPDWFPECCGVEKLERLRAYTLHVLFITETEFLDDFLKADARLKIFYHIGPRANLTRVLRHKEVIVFVNSTNMFELDRRKYGITAVKALGGIHVPELNKRLRNSEEPFTVMVYGRLSRKGKGTSLVVKACEKLYRKGYNIRLLLFDSPVDKISADRIRDFRCKVPFEFVVNHPVTENAELFRRADVFVAAEKKGGWANTAAEALASGLPLIGTKTGSRDFLIHNQTGLRVWRHPYFIRKALERIINDPELARKLAANGRKKIAEYSWTRLADFLEEYISSRL